MQAQITCFALVVLSAAALVECSQNRVARESSPGEAHEVGALGNPGQGGNLGTIDMHLQIGPNNSLTSLQYTCTGPSIIPPGQVNFGGAQSVEWVLGGIAAGSGYQCTLTGTDSDGDPCNGTTAPFNVFAGRVSGATVVVQCVVLTDASIAADVTTGSVGIDAAVSVTQQGAFACPGISSFAISPSEIIFHQTAQLALSETGPTGVAADGGPTSSNVIWTATCASPPCGSFSPSANAANPAFTCGGIAETVTITAQVTNYETNIANGVTSDVCAREPFTTMTATIQCEEPATGTCFGALPDSCPLATGGNVCVNFQTDPNNCGACGVVCSAAQATCSAGICGELRGGPCVQLVGGVPADNTGNTACIQCDQNTGGLCTATEAVIVTRDRIKGLTSAGKPTSGSCYECAVTNGIIDSTIQAFSGNECGDLTGADGPAVPRRPQLLYRVPTVWNRGGDRHPEPECDGGLARGGLLEREAVGRLQLLLRNQRAGRDGLQGRRHRGCECDGGPRRGVSERRVHQPDPRGHG
jgi:hypothetical protein